MIWQWTSTQVREFQRNPITLEGLEDANEHTYEVLDSIMLWSFNVCAKGKWPSCNHEGRPFTSKDGYRYDNRGLPFAGGLHGALSQILGDWKWEVECLGLPQNYKKNDMCHDCYCTKNGPLSYKDLREDNPGFLMRRTNEEWQAAVDGKIGILKDKPLHKSMVKRDFMHVSPLGILPEACGPTLEELCNENVFGDVTHSCAWKEVMGMQLKVASQEYKEWCGAQCIKHSGRKFSVKRLSKKNKGDRPILKAKARECLHIAQWLFTKCKKDNDHQRNRWLCFWGHDELYKILKTGSQFLTDTECVHMKRAMRAILISTRALRAEASASGTKRWHITPKHHALLEMITEAVRAKLNPAYHWCWADEDIVGRLSRVAKRCHGRTMARSALKRWAL